MSRAAAGPRIRHAMRGRLRVYLPGLTDSHRRPIEIRLGRLPGVRHVRANPLTGSVLVQFDPGTTDETAVLAELRPAPAAEPPAPQPSRLPLLLRLAGVAVGGALLLARRLGLWTGALPGGRALTTVAGVLGLLVSAPPARAALEHCLGPGAAELLRSLTDLLGNVVGGDWLGLTLQLLAALSA